MLTRLLTLTGSALLLSACGGGGGGGSSGNSGGTNPPPPPPPTVSYSADVRVTSATTTTDFFSGAIGTYSLTVYNAGPDAASNVTVEDVLGPGQALSSIQCAAADDAICPAAGSTTTIPTLPAGGSLTFIINVSIAPSTVGQVTNTLHVSTEGDPAPSNNVATVSANARAPTSPMAPSFVALQSDATEFVGRGNTYNYNSTNALLVATVNGGVFEFASVGFENWHGWFAMPSSQTQLTPGTYSGITGYPSSDATVAGMSWSGDRGCSYLNASFTIDSAIYVAGALSVLDLRFEQRCENSTPALHGQIHWNANDSTLPAGPVNPPPTGLWSPAPGATPATGNYVYLQSDATDFVGRAETHTYTQADSVLTVNVNNNWLKVLVAGNQSWTSDFQTMNGLSALKPGYYVLLQRWGGHNTAFGGFQWSGEGRGCNESASWVAIDNVSYTGTTLTSLDLRFEQRCDKAVAALHGQVHWVASDTTQPPGPKVPPPSGLWAPAPGATPATGNYAYFESETGDYVGGGGTYTYTQTDALLTVTTSGARVHVDAWGDQHWTGDFQGMNTLTQIQPGYYGNLLRFPLNNPAIGGLSVTGVLYGCNTLTGWFVVDQITYAGNTVASVDLRFEQHCEGLPPALHGKIHWAADDPTQPPGPQNPPPANLWKPASGTTPATGNYVYLESENGDFVGDGNTYTFTDANSILKVNSFNAPVNVFVTSDAQWTGEFIGRNGVTQLTPGYYGNLHHTNVNPATGGLSWSGDHRGCNTLDGWFVIDSITYVSGAIATLDLRFEQHCEGYAPALHGKVHWDKNAVTAPPGPQSPPPANLWAPAPGATPAAGNYVYITSELGEYLGQGQTYTAVAPGFTIDLVETAGYMTVTVNGPHGGFGQFKTMDSITAFQPGYYGILERYPFHNPVKGGMDWTNDGRACDGIQGWFVVDSETYAAGTLASIDLRFEVNCRDNPFTSAYFLHGKIHWIR